MATAVRDLERTPQRPPLRVVPGVPEPTPHYWLRRLVVLCVLFLVLGAVVVAVRSLSAQPASAASAEDIVVVLGPGETVWDLARRYQPLDYDTSAWVSEVVAYNGVDARTLQPGTPIKVPVAVEHVQAVEEG